MSGQAVAAVIDWYDTNKRDLPWRRAGTTAWGVLVAEVMAQQTPVARVAPQWVAWMSRWPSPADLAAADTAAVITQWDRLGYPRRALRLHECARAIRDEHEGVVPDTYAELVALPGVGDYTACAVIAFAFGRRAVVLDTNVRRVIARVFGGVANHAPHITAAERAAVDAVTPAQESTVGGELISPAAGQSRPALSPQPSLAAQFSQAVMELGAIVCRPTPLCDNCPLSPQCSWRAAGYPAADQPARRPQTFAGTDRQARGVVMRLLRESGTAAVSADVIRAAWHDESQLQRALASLVADGLAETTVAGQYHLPSHSGNDC